MHNSSNVVRPGAGVQTPSAVALHASTSAAKRAKKDAPVRQRFFMREQVGEPDPPLARILRGARGGRGGDVRLRLYLSLLWLVRDDPVLSFPARSWAALLGLDEPETKGARRVKDALGWLAEHEFVAMRRAAGHDSEVEVRDDAGTGERYQLPGAAYQRLRDRPALAQAHRYTRIPGALWSLGWMSILSGAGVAMLLVLLHETERTGASAGAWISPSLADTRYGLSEDTRGKGVLQLERAGLVSVHRRAVAPDDFDYRKVRNVYELHQGVLATGPVQLRTNLSRSELRRPQLDDPVPQDEPFGPATSALPRT